jgi:DNA-binding beta-propeller fold protein YncE
MERDGDVFVRFNSSKISFLALAVAAALATFDCADAGDSAAPYTVTKTIALGGADRWDYLHYDQASHRLYVAHDTEMTVVDGRSGKELGHIKGLAAAQGVAILKSSGEGFVASGEQAGVVPFDLKSFKPGSRIPAADDADAVVFDPLSGRIFVANGDSKTITIVDPAKKTALETIDAGGVTQFMVTDDKGKLFVNIEAPDEIARIDGQTGKIDAHWPLPGCVGPHGLAFDRTARRLFASCSNAMLAVVNADTGALVASLPIGKGTDAAGFDEKRKLIFSSNGEGTLSVIREVSPDKYETLEPVPTAPGARTMAVDSETGRIFVVTADVLKADPPKKVGGAPHFTFKPGTVKLLFLDPKA